MRRHPLLWGIALVCALQPDRLRAQEDPADSEEAALLDLLASETDLATRTRQNADYVPGIVSVLHGDDLAALGARTALDALALVPGIEVLRDAGGNATLRVRGIDFFFNSGNVKVLVDSLDMGAETSALNSAILLMPIAQVERIEVIRGPGSSLHGDYAFTGLVNIITRQQEGRAIAETADGGLRRGVLTAGGSSGDWQFGANLSATVSDRYDAAGGGPADERHRFGNAHLQGLGWSLKTGVLDRQQLRPVPGPPPQPGQPPPPPGTQRRYEKVRTHELRYQHEVGAERQFGVALTLQDADSRDGPNGYAGDDLTFGGDALWRFGPHLLVAEANLTRRTIDRANSNAAQGAPANQTILARGDQRNLLSLMLQDQIDFGERVTLTGGLRFDDLRGIDDRLTPRLALVWRLDEHHSLKVQYAEGFRTPTFIELFSAGPNRLSDVDFEAIATSELGYLYRHEHLSFRATLFHSKVDNLILRVQPPAIGHDNLGELRSQGLELEAERRFGEHWRIMATASRADTRDSRGAPLNGRVDSFGEPEWLANLAVLYTPLASTTFGIHWNHVADRSNPGAPDVPGYDRVDAAWTQQLGSALTLRIALRNVLDDDIVYISRLPPNRLQLNDYSERHWSVELGWQW